MRHLPQRRSSQRFGSLISALFFLLLVGCSDDDRSEAPIQPPVEPTVEALFDSTANPPVLPFPNAIYASSDGRLALPLPADSMPGDLSDFTVAVNTMDGFSTIAPISIDFVEAIDETSIQGGDNVRVFEIRLDADGAPTEILAELSSDSEYRVSVSAVQDSRLLIKALKPLNGSSHYLIGISNSLLAVSGLHMGPSADYLALRSGDSSSSDVIDTARLGELVQAQEELLIESGLQQDNIVVSLSFPTHSTSQVLEFINSIADSRPIPLTRPTMVMNGEEQPLTSAPFASTALLFGLTPAGQADIYTGSIELPYYMNVPTSVTDDVVLDSFMRDAAGEAILPPVTSLESVNVTVPVLLTIPNTSLNPALQRPIEGWPIAIYQHGITGSRINLLAIADALAARGVATIAIDQPLHGIVPGDFNQALVNGYSVAGVNFYRPEIERHFNLDLDGDDALDPGGAHFSSPRNLLTFRDNLRQCVSDLIYLSRSISEISLPGESSPTFDPERIHFFSLSLGSMVGTMLAGVNSDVDAFSFAAPGGGNTKFTEGSPSFRGDFLANLAAAGFEQGTQEYEDALTKLTTINGPGDPINYATRAGELHPVHINEIVGDGTVDNLPDQTIPNTAVNAGAYEGLVLETAPLSGTEPIIRAMNLQALLTSTSNSAGLRIAARLVQGVHTSQVNYFSAPAVTQEIQRQTATFLASDGNSIEVGNSELLEMNFIPAE
jgi:hypothetical protein